MRLKERYSIYRVCPNSWLLVNTQFSSSDSCGLSSFNHVVAKRMRTWSHWASKSNTHTQILFYTKSCLSSCAGRKVVWLINVELTNQKTQTWVRSCFAAEFMSAPHLPPHSPPEEQTVIHPSLLRHHLAVCDHSSPHLTRSKTQTRESPPAWISGRLRASCTDRTDADTRTQRKQCRLVLS